MSSIKNMFIYDYFANLHPSRYRIYVKKAFTIFEYILVLRYFSSNILYNNYKEEYFK